MAAVVLHNAHTISLMQAEERKGYSSMVTGVIISCSPLCMVVLSPVFGYFVSMGNGWCLYHTERKCTANAVGVTEDSRATILC